MLLAGDLVIVAMMALMVLLLVAGAEARWRRRGRRAMADEPRPTAGSDLMPAGIHHARPHPVARQGSGAPGLAHAQRLPRRPEIDDVIPTRGACIPEMCTPSRAVDESLH